MITVDYKNNRYSFITLAQKFILFFWYSWALGLAIFSSHLKKLHCSWFLVSSAAVLYLLESKQQKYCLMYIHLQYFMLLVIILSLITYYKFQYKFILHILIQSHLQNSFLVQQYKITMESIEMPDKMQEKSNLD